MAQRNGGAARLPSASATYPGSGRALLLVQPPLPPPSGASLPRVHRPRTLPLPDAAGASPNELMITLAQPRSGVDRTQNEYVDTPFRAAAVVVPRAASPRGNNKPPRLSPGAASTSGGGATLPPVTKQPGSVTTFKKESASTASSVLSTPVSPGCSSPSPECASRASIICQECGRCRCEACRRPRPLPSRWLCDDSCLCASETVLDYASCLCCVKAVFYHCSKDHDVDREGASCADKPCSCLPHRRCLRWGCMGLLSLLLPCLWCYWPLKGCLKACEACYQRYHNQGCTCIQRNTSAGGLEGSSTPEKRLLDAATD